MTLPGLVIKELSVFARGDHKEGLTAASLTVEARPWRLLGRAEKENPHCTQSLKLLKSVLFTLSVTKLTHI